MYAEQVAWTNNDIAAGDQINTASRDYQKGIATVEVEGTVGSPVVTLYGKLIKSDVAVTDSGWVELAQWTATTANYVAGANIDIYPYLSCKVTNNNPQTGGAGRNVLVVVGYNSRA